MSGYLRRLAPPALPPRRRTSSRADRGRAAAALHAAPQPRRLRRCRALFAAVVSVWIVVRLGLIEAVLRFYYREDEDPAGSSAPPSRASSGSDDRRPRRSCPSPGRSPKYCSIGKPPNSTRRRTGPDRDRRPLGATLFEYLLTLYRLTTWPRLLHHHDRQRHRHDRADRRPRGRGGDGPMACCSAPTWSAPSSSS